MKTQPLVSARIFKRDLLLLFVLALLIRLLAAWPQQQPNYMDAAYSYVNALNLAAGRGFVEDFVWNYLDEPTPPPHPSHLYWMPLTSLLAWLGMAVGGTSYRAAQIGFIFISASLAPITCWTTAILGGQRWQSWLAALLAIFSGFYFPFWTAIDNFTPFAVAGSLALLFAWRGMISSQKNYQLPITNYPIPKGHFVSDPQSLASGYLIAAGVCAGLAHLARADGPLLLIAIILAYLLHLLTQTNNLTASNIQSAIPFTLYLLLGYLLIMAPWFIRNWRVVGTPLPTAGSQSIWLPTANDLFSSYGSLFSYGQELSARTFFGQGLGPVLQGRWWALIANFQTVLAVWGMIFVGPLALVGFWHRRGHRLIQLAGLYALLLFGVMTVVFAFPGALGGLFHSGGALLPFIYAAALIGLARSVDWVSTRRRHWNAPLAKRVFGVSLVIMAIMLSGFIYYRRVINNNVWNKADRSYATVAAWIAETDPDATVMINNPPAYRYHGGGLSVVVPNEPVTTTLQVAREYQADYLILEPNHPAPLSQLYNQTLYHPHLSLVKSFGQIHIFEIIEP